MLDMTIGLQFFTPLYSIDVLLFFLVFYFIITLLYSILSHFITPKGSVFIFSSILIFVLFSLIVNLNSVVLHEAVLTGSWSLNLTAWNLPAVAIAIRLDALSFFFVLLVVLIGCATNIYTLNYFKGEASVTKLYCLLNLFICGMLLLVLGGNFYTLFLGWESIGLTSFFLINFWQTRTGTLKSSYKAFIFNQISDACLLVFFVLVWNISQESNFADILLHFKTHNDYDVTNLRVATIFLVIGCGIKSAQIGCHIWLPDSMEAPVPASALIHSATLVSAGLYVLLRLHPIVELTVSYTIISYWGALTAAYGGLVAASQTDVKKVLAYSTISHCGFLFVTLGFNNLVITIVYLYLHGIFKALTFFSVGSFIKKANSQDMRSMGLMARVLPFDTVILIIAVTNLGGFPFTFGFLFKKLFLVGLLSNPLSTFVVGCCTIGLLTSIVYSYRIVYYTCFDTMNNKFFINTYQTQGSNSKVSDGWSFTSVVQYTSFIILYLFALFFYIYIYKYFIDFGLGVSLFDNYSTLTAHDITFIETHYKNYYYYYYSLFILVSATICIVEWRASLSWAQRIHTYVYLLCTAVLIHNFTWWETQLTKSYNYIDSTLNLKTNAFKISDTIVDTIFQYPLNYYFTIVDSCDAGITMITQSIFSCGAGISFSLGVAMLKIILSIDPFLAQIDSLYCQYWFAGIDFYTQLFESLKANILYPVYWISTSLTAVYDCWVQWYAHFCWSLGLRIIVFIHSTDIFIFSLLQSWDDLVGRGFAYGMFTLIDFYDQWDQLVYNCVIRVGSFIIWIVKFIQNVSSMLDIVQNHWDELRLSLIFFGE